MTGSETRSKNKKATKSALDVAMDFSSSCKSLTLSNYLGVLLWLGWFTILPALLLVTVLSWYHARRIFYFLITVLVMSAVAPINPKVQPKWTKHIGMWCMQSAKHYFGAKLCYEDRNAVQDSGPAVFIIEPHDVLPLSLFVLSDFIGENKGHKNVGCLSGACFRTPLMRQIYTWCCASSVDKKNLLKIMNEGGSPCICPGGVQEVALMEPARKEVVLFLKQRKGVVRLAMQFGRPIIPTFAFGQRKLYNYWKPPRNKFFTWMSRQVGAIPMLFFGLFNLPLFIPKPAPVTVVVGKPISVPLCKTDDKGCFDDAEVDRYHALMLQGIEQLYEAHKEEFGMGDLELKIV